MTRYPERDSEFAHDVPKSASEPGFAWLRVGLAVTGIIAVFFFLFLPATRTARPAARRVQCQSNLRMIGLALGQYEARYHALPPAWTVDASGRALHSWRTLILPYLDNSEIYQSIDLSKPWDDPVNSAALQAIPSVFRCPESLGATTQTAYLAVVAPGGCFLPDQPRPLAAISDGPASTLMVVEVDANHFVPWMQPSDADEALLLSLGSKGGLPHHSGMNVVYADGHAQWLSAGTPDAIRRALFSIAGHDGAALQAEEPGQR